MKDPEMATRLLIRRIESYIRGRKQVAQHLEESIDTVLKLWTDAGNLEQATLLLKRMQELYEMKTIPEGPDKRAFHPLLQLWKQTSHPNKKEHMAYLHYKIKELYNE